MDSIPNEILLPIIGSLGKEEIPKMRLVSKRFNLLATECVQKLCQVKFTEDSDIAKFITMFENKTVVPFERFEFSNDLLDGSQPLEQFCLKFGKIIKYWGVFGFERWVYLEEVSISENLQILLENCVNVEEIDYSIVLERYAEIDKPNINIPVLRNLKTIIIMWFNVENENLLPLLHQIVETAPNLRRVSIEKIKYSYSSPVILCDTLNQLYNMNGTVCIKVLDISVALPAENIGDVQKLFTISTQFTIVDLALKIRLNDRDLEEIPQQVELLSKWIQQLTSVRMLYLAYNNDMPNRNANDPPEVPIALPLHPHANIKCLYLEGLMFALYVPVPSQSTEFPSLTSLTCNHGNTHNFIFSGCVFPNVKVATISLKTEEECEEWPLMLPNVEELFVRSKTLKGIFRFPKLRKLDISLRTDDDDDDNPDDYLQVCEQHWDNLTGGAEYISNSRISSFPVKSIGTSDSMETFRNLPLLTHLKFSGETVGCWKGIAYASKTRQLRCLEELAFSKEYSIEEPYRTELMTDQPSLRILPDPFLFFSDFWDWTDDFDI